MIALLGLANALAWILLIVAVLRLRKNAREVELATQSFDFFFDVDGSGRCDKLPEQMAKGLGIRQDLFRDRSPLQDELRGESGGTTPAPLVRGRRMKLPRIDGGNVWIALNAVPGKGTSGSAKWHCACYDVTSQIENESGSMSSARLAALGEMAGSIAHEINNPLCIIANVVDNLDYAMQVNWAPETLLRDSFQKIRETIDRIARIVGSMLMLSRDGAKDQFQETKLSACIEPVLSLTTDRLIKKGIRIQLEQIPDVSLMVNHTMIAQVILNILSNAIDALADMPDPLIKISTSLPPNAVEIVIENNGGAIPADTASRIFDPFFTTKNPNHGTGLGLSVSKRIIEQHGGVLSLVQTEKSGQASGSVAFVIRIPRHPK